MGRVVGHWLMKERLTVGDILFIVKLILVSTEHQNVLLTKLADSLYRERINRVQQSKNCSNVNKNLQTHNFMLTKSSKLWSQHWEAHTIPLSQLNILKL